MAEPTQPRRSRPIGQLVSDVRLLAAEPRPAGIADAHHDRCRRYLTQRLADVGARPYAGRSFELPYRSEGRRFCNIVARFPGRDMGRPPVLLGAHYDSCDCTPGASDNAAAVAIGLAVAERLAANPAAGPVVVALFDAEEPPYFSAPSMGSVRFYEDQRVEEVRCAIVLDLMGHAVPVPGAEHGLFVAGAESDSALLGVVRDAAVPAAGGELGVAAVLHRYAGDLSDHAIFRLNGRPFLFLSEAHWADYHQPTDTADRIDFAKLAAEVDYVEALVRGASERPEAAPASEAGSFPLEQETLRHLIPASVRARFGAGDLEDRADIDRLAFGLMGDGL